MAGRRRRAERARTGRSRGATVRERSGWRATVDSWGGFTVIGGITAAVVVMGIIVVRNPLGFSVSDAPLVGEAVSSGTATHLPDGSLDSTAPLPPADGPHYATPQRVRAYAEPVADGNVVHALEHGVVWISYRPDLLTTDDIDALEDLRSDFSRDVILAPRPANANAVVAVSWGRRQVFDVLDLDMLRSFVTTNRNRSPEPGIR